MNKLTDVDNILLNKLKKHFKNYPLSPYVTDSFVLLNDSYESKHKYTQKIYAITMPILMCHIDKNFEDYLKHYQLINLKPSIGPQYNDVFNRICFYKFNGYYEPIRKALLKGKLQLNSLTCNILGDLLYFYEKLPELDIDLQHA